MRIKGDGYSIVSGWLIPSVWLPRVHRLLVVPVLCLSPSGSLRAERMDTVKKGIPCFDYSETGPKGQGRITFNFVAGDEDVAKDVTVSLGDPDPMTGEEITDLTFFREYHCQRNREIYYNKKAVAVPWSGKEKKERQALREEIASEFVRLYGYAPDRETLDWLLNERMPKRYRKEIDSFVNDEGESFADCMAEFADPAAEKAFREVEEEGHTLDDFAETLTPIQQDVFRMLRMESEGIGVRGMGKALAEKWGVKPPDISYMKQQIGKKLKRWMQEE